MNRPADTSSIIDSAICAVASVTRNRAAALAPDGCPAWFFKLAIEIGARAVKRRVQAEQEAGAERQDGRDEHHDGRRELDINCGRRLGRQERT